MNFVTDCLKKNIVIDCGHAFIIISFEKFRISFHFNVDQSISVKNKLKGIDQYLTLNKLDMQSFDPLSEATKSTYH